MPEIQSLTDAVNRLTQKVDFWNKAVVWALFAAALVAVLVVITTRMAVVRTRELSDAQNRLMQEKDREVKIAQRRLELDLSQQEERTAKAQKDAADAALALAKFKEPRTIPPEDQQKLIAALKPFAGEKFALAVFPDPEPLALARTLDTLLKSAGWQRVPAQIQRDGGVLVSIA